jgi:hypothetical protein
MGRAEFSAGADGAGERRGAVAAMIFLCTCVALAAPPLLARHTAASARLLALCSGPRGRAGLAACAR